MKHNRKEYVWYRDKTWYPIKVKEIVKDIDVNNFNTVIPILKKLNYPAIEREWYNTVEHCIRQSQGSEVVLKKYVSKMWLMGYKPFTFEDSERFNQP